jgi:uncharacterized protein (DUF433 family)
MLSAMLMLIDQKAPVREGRDGVCRIAGTRVSLDTVVAAFEDGATAEEIAQQYPTLALADVYAVIGYYLRQREQVQAYLRERQAQAKTIRTENEAHFNPSDIRARLLDRQAK